MFLQDTGNLTAEDLSSVAKLGHLLTKRAEGQACSHQVRLCAQ